MPVALSKTILSVAEAVPAKYVNVYSDAALPKKVTSVLEVNEPTG